MDSSEQRRKRKRTARPATTVSYSASYLFSVRSLSLCFCFIAFLYLLSYWIPMTSSAFRPVLVVPTSLSLLSSSDFVRDYSNRDILWYSNIEDRVLFPDHLLLLVSNRKRNGFVEKYRELECVYSSLNSDDVASMNQNVLSVDEYDDFRIIVRCPLPPANYSAVVNLRNPRKRAIDFVEEQNYLWNNRSQAVNSWEKVVYTAALDGDTAVVFVKGLSLRSDRESDPTQFNCHFGLGNWGKNRTFVLTTKAISAAQEVIRCRLPRSILKNPNKAQGIRVTIGVKPPNMKNSPNKVQAHDHVIVPSLAKIFRPKSIQKNEKKYELCVCTMVWNQAAALREWIVYHAWLGVEKWFIYDNNSDDSIEDVIGRLELENYNVSRHVWPWIKTQEAGFSHCALRARDECKWVSFMDVDEYFYFPFPTRRHQKMGFPGRNSLKKLVSNFSSSAPTVGEIRTSCHSFGPSGLSLPPRQGVTVGYTCRVQSPERHKSIVRPDALHLALLNVVHHFHLREGFRYVNLHQSTAVINHYKYQVWEVFKAKFFRRVATYVADWQDNQKEGSRDRAPGLGTEPIQPPNWRLQFCDVWDTGLRDFVLANMADPATGVLPWERERGLLSTNDT